jgi:predicted nucleic acid-binding protein
MRLVVDTNILVAELLRERGRVLIQCRNLDLYIAEKMKNETLYELKKRLKILTAKINLTEEIAKQQLEFAIELIETKIFTFPLSFYQSWELEARKRIPRDPNDWEAIALSLALSCDIWTEDKDFFGCGCAIWTTETLLLQLNS